VSLYVTHYNHVPGPRGPADHASGRPDRVWSIGDLLDAALATLPVEPTTPAPERRKRFRV